MDTGARITLWVLLKEEERFRFRTPTGAIKVEQVRVTLPHWKDGQCHVRGPAIKADGTMAMFGRESWMPIDDLPEAVRAGIRIAAEEGVGLAESAASR